MDDVIDFVQEMSKSSKLDVLSHRKQLRKSFKAMDINGDGTLTFKEFVACFDDLGWKIRESTLRSAFDEMDADESGSVSFPEFLERMTGKEEYLHTNVLLTRLRDRVLARAQKSTLKLCFVEDFSDGDDKADAAAFFEAVREYGLDYTKSERQRIWRHFDLSDDGYISYREFHDAITSSWSSEDFDAEAKVKDAIRTIVDESKDADAEDLFDALDDDGDGKVDMDEFGTTRRGTMMFDS